MQPPIFVRPPTDEERQVLEVGLRSPDAFVLRRCQIILASARGERASQIAGALSCDDQTVRNTIHAFNAWGPGALHAGSSRPHTIRATLQRLGVAWKRAKNWITSPDPAYVRKKARATG